MERAPESLDWLIVCNNILLQGTHKYFNSIVSSVEIHAPASLYLFTASRRYRPVTSTGSRVHPQWNPIRCPPGWNRIVPSWRPVKGPDLVETTVRVAFSYGREFFLAFSLPRPASTILFSGCNCAFLWILRREPPPPLLSLPSLLTRPIEVSIILPFSFGGSEPAGG